MLDPGMHIDQYEITNLIGEGTFGLVYRATETDLERVVALKVLKPNIVLMAEFLKRFQREARALAQFSHPNIVQIHRLSQWQDTWYLAMEYVPQSLAQTIGDVAPGNTQSAGDGSTLVAAMPPPPDRAAKTLPLDDALKIIQQVCTGLREAHSRGIIHRDIKPENILLTDEGQVKVCDFGIAHVQGGTRLTTVGRLGTDDYGAPEQLFPERFPNHSLDVRADVRADVYAVCAVLYRLLAGVAPRPAGHPAPLSQFAPDAPDGMVQAIMRGLSWEPGERYPDLDTLTQALEANTGPSIPSDLRDLWDAHEARLKAMGFSIPKDQELVIRNEKDDGVALWIPPGEFMMGSEEGRSHEKPVHHVVLDGFYMDLHPVTVAQYQKYVKETGGVMPPEPHWGWQPDHPIVHVMWEEACAYCQWAGKRLPSEAQWEYAACGQDGRKYPWGNKEPTPQMANFGGNIGKTTAVGSYPSGASAFGLLDMAGNVWERCADWFDKSFYATSPEKNPLNDKISDYNILRGASWYLNPYYLRGAFRYWYYPDLRYYFIGFRASRQKNQ